MMRVLKTTDSFTLSFSLIMLILVFWGTGCVLVSPSQREDPKTIVIRNSSSNHLKIVTLREANRSHQKAVRFGSISPVPKGLDQAVVRSPSSPPLPKIINVTWVDDQNRSFTQQVELEKILRKTSDEQGDTLIFSINSFGRVIVFLEEYKQAY